MSTLADVIGDYQNFLQTILQKIKDEAADMADFVQLDHMCYRTESLEDYHAKKEAMLPFSDLVGENIINERPIAVFRLHQPILFDGWRIDCVEIPAPKEGAPFPAGLEHVEFVIYDDSQTFLKKYADKPFNLAAVERQVNPEIGLKLSGGFGVKFHIVNLLSAVYIEQKLDMTHLQ